jgi:hypothetical protein
MSNKIKRTIITRVDEHLWEYLKHLSVDNKTSMNEIIVRLINNHKNIIKNTLTNSDKMIA